MQSKGWIWQVCLLLTSVFIFSNCLPSTAAFGQTETTPKEQVKPKSDGTEQDDGDAPEDDSEQEKPSDDAPESESEDDQDGEEQKKSSTTDDDDDEGSDDEESGTTGPEDLAEAFLLKISARTTTDLDKIVKLCQSALKKGLDDNETRQANFLASESLLRFAEGMAKRTFATPQDKRWQIYRAQAMPRLRRAVEFDETNVAAFILLAKFEAMDPRAKADALKNIEKAIELSADDRTQLSNALVIRARLKEDKEEVLSDLNQAIKHNPDNVQAHELRAWTLLSDLKVNKAIEDFEYWFKAQPKNFSARLIVAQRLQSAGDLFDADVQEKVIGMLDEAAEIDPKSGIPAAMKAQIYLQQKEFDKAVDAATKSIDLDKRSPNAFQIRAAALAEKGDLDAALADANRLMKLDLMDGYRLRSQIFIQLSEYAKAIEDIQAMSAADPTNEVLLQQLAMLYNIDLRPEEAIEIYNRLLRNSVVPDEEDQPGPVRRVLMAKRVDLLSRRADARLSTGEHGKAVDDYKESLGLIDELLAMFPENAKSKPPRDSGLLNNYAWLLSTSPEDDIRDGELAIELATEAAESTKFEQPHILSTVAAGYAETGDFESAIEWIEKGLKVNKAAGEKDGASEEAIKKQEKSLRAELEFYKEEKPWRELTDLKKERAEAKAEKEKKSDEADSDSDSDTDSQEKVIEEESSEKKMEESEEAEDSDSKDKKSKDKKSKDRGTRNPPMTKTSSRSVTIKSVWQFNAEVARPLFTVFTIKFLGESYICVALLLATFRFN